MEALGSLFEEKAKEEVLWVCGRLLFLRVYAAQSGIVKMANGLNGPCICKAGRSAKLEEQLRNCNSKLNELQDQPMSGVN